MRQIRTVHVGPVQTNCYLIGNPETEQVLIIDPGADADAIREEIRSMNMMPAAILLTHGHFDHIGAVRELLTVYDIPVVAGKGAEDFLKDYGKVAPGAFQEHFTETQMHFPIAKYAEDEELIEYGGFPITCLATPGHTEDGMCYFFPTESVLFSGDTLFMESVGRTGPPAGGVEVVGGGGLWAAGRAARRGIRGCWARRPGGSCTNCRARHWSSRGTGRRRTLSTKSDTISTRGRKVRRARRCR